MASIYIEEDKLYFFNKKRRDGLYDLLRKQGIPVKTSVLENGIMSADCISDARLEKSVVGRPRRAWEKLHVLSVFYLRGASVDITKLTRV